MQVYENIPESAKLATAVGPAALSLFGVPLEHWILILSAIVSILVIIEKIPKAIESMIKIRNKIWRRNGKME